MDKLPEGWEYTRLDEVAEINPPRPPINDPNLPVTFLAMEDVSESARIQGGSVRPYAEVAKGYTPFIEDDVLIAKITPCFENGKGAYAENLSNGIGFGSTEFHVLRATDSSSSRFLYYLSTSPEFRERGEANMQGSAGQKRVPTDFLRSYLFPLPPLAEQRKIAAILGTWDAAIATAEQLIAALQKRKQGLMQRLLTCQVRFPEFANSEWEERNLGYYFYEFSRTNRANEDLPVLSCSKLYGVIPQAERFEKRIASQNIQRYKIVEQGDLVFDPMLLWDASIGLVEAIPVGVVSPAYTTLKFREDRGERNYFRYLLKTHYFRENYKFVSQGTNVRRRKVPVSAFLGISHKFPTDPHEMSKITKVLEVADDEIAHHQAICEQLKQQKQALMQQLLTGKVRVNVTDEAKYLTETKAPADAKVAIQSVFAGDQH